MKAYFGRYPSKRTLARNPNAKRKISVRIDSHDTWGTYSDLAHIIHPLLIELKSRKHGSPSCMPAFEEQTNHQYPQLCFEFYKDGDDNAGKRGHEQWTEIMDKMIWSFEQIINEDRDDQFHSGTIDFKTKPIYDSNGKITGYELVKGPNDTSKFDVDGYKKYYKKIQEGLDLFGKYYMNPWD